MIIRNPQHKIQAFPLNPYLTKNSPQTKNFLRPSSKKNFISPVLDATFVFTFFFINYSYMKRHPMFLSTA